MPTPGLDSTAVLNALRAQLSDTDSSGSGRWTDGTLLSFIDRANKRLVRDILFPDCRVTQTTKVGTQLYQFPLMLKVKAIYVAGELAVPSDLPTLEGRQVGAWDATGPQGTASQDAPIGSTGVNQPSWAVQEPLSYPVDQGLWATPAPDAQGWDSSQRPRYYWRGGWLGLVPQPANAVTIELDGVRQPDTITSRDQSMTTPANALDALVWGSYAIAKAADDTQGSDRDRQVGEQNYEREKRKLLAWRGEYPGEQRLGPKPSVLRAAYTGYRMRRNR